MEGEKMRQVKFWQMQRKVKQIWGHGNPDDWQAKYIKFQLYEELKLAIEQVEIVSGSSNWQCVVVYEQDLLIFVLEQGDYRIVPLDENGKTVGVAFRSIVTPWYTTLLPLGE